MKEGLYRLSSFCTWERPKKGKKYPEGSILLQCSATDGQTVLLREDSVVEDKYCVILPDRSMVEPGYLHILIDDALPSFLARYQTGLNFVPDNLRHLTIPRPPSLERQRQVVRMWEAIDRAIESEEDIIRQVKQVKAFYLDGMFC